MKKYLLIKYRNKKIWVNYRSKKIYPIFNSIFSKKIHIDKKPLNIKDYEILPPFVGRNSFGLAYNYKSLLPKKVVFDEPLVFIKSATSIIGNNEKIVVPSFVNKLWIEAELAIIISKKAKNVSISKANNYILGYTCSNDVTAQNICGRDHHLARSKSLDTFAPIGQFLVKDIDTNDLEITSTINKKIIQKNKTSDRVLNNQECVALVSKFFTLMPGDIIFTGTPAFVKSPLIKKGDKVSVRIAKIGKLNNKVV